MPLAEALNILCSLVSSVYRNHQLFPFTTILGWQYLARYYLVPCTWSHMTGLRVCQRVMILHLRTQMVSSFPLFLWTIQFQAYFIIHFQEINVVNNAVWFVSYPSRRSSFGQGKYWCCFRCFIWDSSSVPWKWREFALFHCVDPLCRAGCDGPPLQPCWWKGLCVLWRITLLNWWVSFFLFSSNLLQM